MKTMYDMNDFPKRIHTLRKAKGLSQEELAGRLNVSAQAVSKWENGQSYPDITAIPASAGVKSVSSLHGQVNGSGDVDAGGVTARRADILIEHNGEVKIGCVLEESCEQVKQNGTVTILRRGAG
jgi:transcriptional regulator with XRE-family HTH domain